MADCESNNSVSIVVSGGFNNERMMSPSSILTTTISGGPSNAVPLTRQGNPEQLLEDDHFIQQHSFPVPSELLTAAFVRKHVRDETKQAVLLDKKQPHSDLLAIHGNKGGLHIFDKTHGMWLASL